MMGALVATAASAQPAPRTGGFTLAQTELLPQLPNCHLVLLKDQGHDDWEDQQKPELDHLIAGFLKDGVVDASAYAFSPIPFK